MYGSMNTSLYSIKVILIERGGNSLPFWCQKKLCLIRMKMGRSKDQHLACSIQNLELKMIFLLFSLKFWIGVDSCTCLFSTSPFSSLVLGHGVVYFWMIITSILKRVWWFILSTNKWITHSWIIIILEEWFTFSFHMKFEFFFSLLAVDKVVWRRVGNRVVLGPRTAYAKLECAMLKAWHACLGTGPSSTRRAHVVPCHASPFLKFF